MERLTPDECQVILDALDGTANLMDATEKADYVSARRKLHAWAMMRTA